MISEQSTQLRLPFAPQISRYNCPLDIFPLCLINIWGLLCLSQFLISASRTCLTQNKLLDSSQLRRQFCFSTVCQTRIQESFLYFCLSHLIFISLGNLVDFFLRLRATLSQLIFIKTVLPQRFLQEGGPQILVIYLFVLFLTRALKEEEERRSDLIQRSSSRLDGHELAWRLCCPSPCLQSQLWGALVATPPSPPALSSLNLGCTFHQAR